MGRGILWWPPAQLVYINSICGANCLLGISSLGRIVWGEMSMGRNAHGAKCPSMGRNVCGTKSPDTYKCDIMVNITLDLAMCNFPSGTDKYTWQALFSVPILTLTLLALTLTLTLTQNPNHNHTPRTEISLELIHLTVAGDGKYHLRLTWHTSSCAYSIDQSLRNVQGHRVKKVTPDEVRDMVRALGGFLCSRAIQIYIYLLTYLLKFRITSHDKGLCVVWCDPVSLYVLQWPALF